MQLVTAASGTGRVRTVEMVLRMGDGRNEAHEGTSLELGTLVRPFSHSCQHMLQCRPDEITYTHRPEPLPQFYP